MNKLWHLLTVQRGEKFKPLKYANGEYIYKESERYQASEVDLSKKQLEERKLLQEADSEKVGKFMVVTSILFLYSFLTLFAFFTSVSLGVFMVVIGVLASLFLLI